MAEQKKNEFLNTLTVIVSIYILFCLVETAVKNNIYQWDFKVFYFAAKAFFSGLNPYDISSLCRISGESLRLNYVYSPVTLFFFSPFIVFNYSTSYYIYFMLKLAVFFMLIFIWRNKFLDRGISYSLLFIFSMLFFDQTGHLDFASGNISIFEQFILWSAFLFFLRDRTIPFLLLILILTLFKITPIFFVCLIFFKWDRKKLRHLILFAILLVIIIVAIIWAFPKEYLYTYINNIINKREYGSLNPCSFALIKDLVFLSGNGYRGYVIIAYLLFCFLICLLTLKSTGKLAKKHSLSDETKRKYILYLFCFLYALIMPRFKVYSYLLLIVPVLFIFLKLFDKKMLLVFLVLGSCCFNFSPLLYAYFSFILIFILWCYFIYCIETDDQRLA